MSEMKKDELAEDQALIGEEDRGDVTAEVEALRAERDEMRDRWMRAIADAENAPGADGAGLRRRDRLHGQPAAEEHGLGNQKLDHK